MYSFIAYYCILSKNEDEHVRIDVDLTPIDDEMRDYMPEELFAWKCATERAWKKFKDIKTEIGGDVWFYRLDMLSM